MAEKKVELKEEMLGEITGGLSYDNINKIVHANGNRSVVYPYNEEDFPAIDAYVRANYAKYSYAERDQKLIEGLLEAGLIRRS